MSLNKYTTASTDIRLGFTIAILLILNIIIAQPEVNKINGVQTDTLQVDIDQSQIEWIGRKVTGVHSGTLELSEGWVTMNGSDLLYGKFIFDMTSIKNTDIESSEWRLKLENHLQSEDFFNVDSFPHAILNIKKNRSNSNTNNPDSTYLVYADLTIRGITHEISLYYQLDKSERNFIAIGSVDIDRTLYNIKYKSESYFSDLGDKIIYDDFTIKFTVHTLPQ